ncbi:MAG: crotonase/enoyl-CoA hydratase family protein [Candidatus Dadabacteria bacterium]|nr:MAG: crotonase/enoyl-CoA hydratase family protein [Candidatus Dadabacteria bacterium]
MSEAHFLYEKRGHVALCTFNRPDKRNALSIEMLVRMADAWEEADNDRDVRAIVLTGKGGVFCAGSDLGAMSSGKWDAGDVWMQRMQEDPELHWKALLLKYLTKKPLIAAVEGFALAGGTEILQGTDIRVAGRSAVFGVTEVQLGLFPLGGSTVRLRRQLPYAIAAEMLLSGRRLTADEALHYGLINYVVDDGKALDKAMEVAERIAKCGPVAVQAVKRALVETDGVPAEDAIAKSLEIGEPVFRSKDAREGPTAFMEKREPRFTGE